MHFLSISVDWPAAHSQTRAKKPLAKAPYFDEGAYINNPVRIWFLSQGTEKNLKTFQLFLAEKEPGLVRPESVTPEKSPP